MLNYLWSAMILAGILYGAVHGQMPAVTEGALSGARDAVSLCLTMAGVTALWTGLMEIAEGSGLTAQVTHALKPFIRFLFPGIPEGHPAQDHICLSCTCNLFGLGNAALPAGLAAMKSLKGLAEAQNPSTPPGVASREMCTFLILNISSLQLIPVNMIAYRAQYGSADPSAVVGPGIAATAVSTLAGILFCKIMDRRRT